MPKSLPDFSFEKQLFEKGYKFIGGVDEVGRGALAVPVVAACVVFKSGFVFSGAEGELINDSKKLTQKQRETASFWIKENALAWGIGACSAHQIDKLGIVKGTFIAFRKAVKNCQIKINFLLVDAFYVPHLKGISQNNQLPIIKGDSLSVSIAAASIIAKVHRDQIMTNLSKKPQYRNYKWESNKGYGTKVHKNAIKERGTSRLHRISFFLKLS
jgi:ribonuclease HII